MIPLTIRGILEDRKLYPLQDERCLIKTSSGAQEDSEVIIEDTRAMEERKIDR